MGLTPRQEKFAQEYVLCGNASEAFKVAYPKSLGWKPASINRKAFDAVNNVKIAARIKEITDESAKRNEITIDSIIAEYDDVIEGAKGSKKYSAIVAAITKKAELCGLFKKHQEQGKHDINIGIIPQELSEMITAHDQN